MNRVNPQSSLYVRSGSERPLHIVPRPAVPRFETGLQPRCDMKESISPATPLDTTSDREP